jgi:hypothetical protein
MLISRENKKLMGAMPLRSLIIFCGSMLIVLLPLRVIGEAMLHVSAASFTVYLGMIFLGASAAAAWAFRAGRALTNIIPLNFPRIGAAPIVYGPDGLSKMQKLNEAKRWF